MPCVRACVRAGPGPGEGLGRRQRRQRAAVAVATGGRRSSGVGQDWATGSASAAHPPPLVPSARARVNLARAHPSHSNFVATANFVVVV